MTAAEAEQKVTAETYRESDRPHIIGMSALVALISALLSLVVGGCAGVGFIPAQMAQGLALAAHGLALVGLLSFILLAWSALRYYGWRLFGVPPRHTVRVQFLRAMSELGFIPPDATKWSARDVEVFTDLREKFAYVKFRGGLLKPLIMLEPALHHNGYIREARDVHVQPMDEGDNNSGFMVTIDYMHQQERSKWIEVHYGF